MSSTRAGRPASYVNWSDLKSRIDVYDVLERYDWTDKLSPRASGGHAGPCPIHSGERPDQSSNAFTVTHSGKGWRCFGACNRGGSIIDLVALLEETTNKDAGQLLARWFPKPVIPDVRELLQTPALSQEQIEQAYRRRARDAGDHAESYYALKSVLKAHFAQTDRDEIVLCSVDEVNRLIAFLRVGAGLLSDFYEQREIIERVANAIGGDRLLLACNAGHLDTLDRETAQRFIWDLQQVLRRSGLQLLGFVSIGADDRVQSIT